MEPAHKADGKNQPRFARCIGDGMRAAQEIERERLLDKDMLARRRLRPEPLC